VKSIAWARAPSVVCKVIVDCDLSKIMVVWSASRSPYVTKYIAVAGVINEVLRVSLGWTGLRTAGEVESGTGS
jgi:hypothetical protein